MARNLYQTEWNGIDLLEIAKDKSTLNKQGLPNSNFYKNFYAKLKEKKFDLNDDWLLSKLNNSKWLELIITDLSLDMKKSITDLKILSIGSGMGIVELPLIKSGFDVTLHEVQENSFSFIKEKAKNENIQIKYIVGNMEEIQFNNKFDIIYLGTIEYAIVGNREYKKFLSSIYNLLNNNGYLISHDPNPGQEKLTFKNRVGNLLRILNLKKKHPNDSIYWGVLRTLDEKCEYWNKAGFKIEECGIIDQNFSDKIFYNKGEVQKKLIYNVSNNLETFAYLIGTKCNF